MSFLQIVKEMLEALSFPEEENIRYDPHQIICNKRQQN
jgi:hypothetical protein